MYLPTRCLAMGIHVTILCDNVKRLEVTLIETVGSEKNTDLWDVTPCGLMDIY
jgi:hypothetical protein